MENQDLGHQDLSKINDLDEILTLEESQFTESKNTEWTDEKHSLYIKSMETSFIDQLYGSLDLTGTHAQNECSSRPKSSRQKHTTPSGQYKVLRDGCWTKIDFRREEPQQNKASESGVLLASPWFKHYRSPRGHQTRVNLDLQEKTTLPATENQYTASDFNLCHQDYVDGVTEVTDQNFVDEDREEGKSSKKQTRKKQTKKRTKFSLLASSSNDQVVPFGMCSMADDLAADRVGTKE